MTEAVFFLSVTGAHTLYSSTLGSTNHGHHLMKCPQTGYFEGVSKPGDWTIQAQCLLSSTHLVCNSCVTNLDLNQLTLNSAAAQLWLVRTQRIYAHSVTMIARETTSLETQSTNQSDREKVSNRRGETRGQLPENGCALFLFLHTSYKYTSSFGADRPSGGSVGRKVHINDPVNIENSPLSRLPAGQSH